jgi:hypothetical protein
MTTNRLLTDLRVAAWLLLAASLPVVGCSSGPKEPARYAVSGTVTLDGAPLPEGKINFMTPDTGAIDTLDIKEGKFSGKAQAGDRRVEINAYHVEVVDKDGMKSEAQTDLIPPEYNKESKLTAQVTSGGPNTFSFDVKSK